tara:strand:- start:60 stop:368 length:309 start_codon:yes stop_codon:yes gene_type:complete
MRAAALRWREPATGAGLLFRIIGGWFMGERDTTAVTEEPAEEFFEPGLGELTDEDFESLDFAEAVTEKALKAAKRRRAEERLEMLRLREELGDYDLDFGDEL